MAKSTDPSPEEILFGQPLALEPLETRTLFKQIQITAPIAWGLIGDIA